MAREKGIFNASSNYEPLIGAPFDARCVVDYKADLVDPNTWTEGRKYLYNGMIVSVTRDTDENNGVYRLDNRLLYTEYTSWKKIAETDELDNKANIESVYTKEEIDTKIGQIQSFYFEVVESLDEMVSTNALYLLKKDVVGADIYEEYVVVDGKPVLIGETTMDLSNYVKLNQFNPVKNDVDLLKEEIKTTPVLKQYEIATYPTGTVVDYREKEIRIFCPENAPFELQQVGAGGLPNQYYVPFRAYAPQGAVTFKEDMKKTVEDQTVHSFVNNPTAGTDKFGRNYSVVWIALAYTKDEGASWIYYGANSNVNHYVGFDYSVEWYDKDNVLIGTDTIRINLTNKNCHPSTTITTDRLVNGDEKLIFACGNASED